MERFTKSLSFALLSLVLNLFSPILYASATWEHMTTVTAADAAKSDLFGTSVAVDGEYAIVGAYKNDSAGTDTGAAYIYKYDSTAAAWAQQAKITPSDGADADRFGYSVSINGDFAIVGSPYNAKTGAAYVFARTDTQWTQVKKLTPHDGADYDKFGTSVSISGDYAIVGSHYSSPIASYSGSAYIYTFKNSSWQHHAKLTPSDAAAYNLFGISVSISGDFAIVGASGNDQFGSNSGAAYIFNRTDDTWSEQAKLTIPDAAAGSMSGSSVAITAGYAIIGSQNHNGTGAADIFKYENSTWDHDSVIAASDIAGGDYFGWTVSIDSDPTVYGPRVIVGARNKASDSGVSNSGAAYIFENTDTGWQQLNKLTSSAPAENDFFGISVSISGKFAIAGVPNYDAQQTDIGAAYIFKRKAPCPTADLNGDCFVDIADFAIMASQWLTGE